MEKNKKKRKYWYKQYSGFCPICGSETKYKERIYGEKPKDLNEIYISLSESECFCCWKEFF